MEILPGPARPRFIHRPDELRLILAADRRPGKIQGVPGRNGDRKHGDNVLHRLFGDCRHNVFLYGQGLRRGFKSFTGQQYRVGDDPADS